MASSSSTPWTRVDPGAHGYISVSDARPHFFRLYRLHRYNSPEDSIEIHPDKQHFTILHPDEQDLSTIDGVHNLYRHPIFFSETMPELAFVPCRHPSLGAFIGVTQLDHRDWVYAKKDQVSDLTLNMRDLFESYVELFRTLPPNRQQSFIPVPDLSRHLFKESYQIVCTTERADTKEIMETAVARLFAYHVRAFAWCLSARIVMAKYYWDDEWPWEDAAQIIQSLKEKWKLYQLFSHNFSFFARKQLRSIVLTQETSTAHAKFLIDDLYLRGWDLVKCYPQEQARELHEGLRKGEGLENCIRIQEPVHGLSYWGDRLVVTLVPNSSKDWREWHQAFGTKPSWMKRDQQAQREITEKEREKKLREDNWYPVDSIMNYGKTPSSSTPNQPSSSSGQVVRTWSPPAGSRPPPPPRRAPDIVCLPPPVFGNLETARLNSRASRGRGRGRGSSRPDQSRAYPMRSSATDAPPAPSYPAQSSRSDVQERSRSHPHAYHPYQSPHSSHQDLSGSPDQASPRLLSSLRSSGQGSRRTRSPRSPRYRSRSPRRHRSRSPRRRSRSPSYRSQSPRRRPQTSRSRSRSRRSNSFNRRHRSTPPRRWSRSKTSSRRSRSLSPTTSDAIMKSPSPHRADADKRRTRSHSRSSSRTRSRTPPRSRRGSSTTPPPRVPSPDDMPPAAAQLLEFFLDTTVTSIMLRDGRSLRLVIEDPGAAPTPSTTSVPAPNPTSSSPPATSLGETLANRMSDAPPPTSLAARISGRTIGSSLASRISSPTIPLASRMSAPSLPAVPSLPPPVPSSLPAPPPPVATTVPSPQSSSSQPPPGALWWRRFDPPTPPERFWREMWAASTDPGWRQYLVQQRAHWDPLPMTRTLRLKDLYASMVRVNSTWRPIIMVEGGWWDRLKIRMAVEYDPPLLVPWNYDLPTESLPLPALAPPAVPTPTAPISPPLTDAEMGIEYEDSGSVPPAPVVADPPEETFEEMYGQPPSS